MKLSPGHIAFIHIVLPHSDLVPSYFDLCLYALDIWTWNNTISHQLPKQNWNWFKFYGILELPPISRVKNWDSRQNLRHVNHFNMQSEDSEIISSVSWWFSKVSGCGYASQKMMHHTGQPSEPFSQSLLVPRKSSIFFFIIHVLLLCAAREEAEFSGWGKCLSQQPSFLYLVMRFAENHCQTNSVSFMKEVFVLLYVTFLNFCVSAIFIAAVLKLNGILGFFSFVFLLAQWSGWRINKPTKQQAKQTKPETRALVAYPAFTQQSRTYYREKENGGPQGVPRKDIRVLCKAQQMRRNKPHIINNLNLSTEELTG